MTLWFFKTAIFLNEVFYYYTWNSGALKHRILGTFSLPVEKEHRSFSYKNATFLTQGHMLFKYQAVIVLLTNVSVKFSPFYSNGVQY